jgi:Tol biopolymer transport system component
MWESRGRARRQERQSDEDHPRWGDRHAVGRRAGPAGVRRPSPAALQKRNNGLIAYSIGGGEAPNIIRTVKPDGTDDRRLIGPRRKLFRRGPSGPQWSPDGKKLLFGGHHHYDRSAQSLWYSAASGKRLRRIPLGLGSVDRSPRAIYLYGWGWAPDGRHVVLAAGRRFEISKIYTISIDGKHRSTLRRGWSPEWSADGRHIVFSSRIDFGSFPDYVRREEIAVMRPDGSGFRRLTDSSNDSSPRVSPDGRKVLFVRRFAPEPFIEYREETRDEWRSVDIRGRREVLVATHYPWSMVTDTLSDMRYGPPQWTPDGTRIAAVRLDRSGIPDMEVGRLVTISLTGANERIAFTFPGFSWWFYYFSWQPR